MTPESPAAPPPEFSVVVLCYKSGTSIVPFVERLHAMLECLSLTWEIILVGNYHLDDADETPAILHQLEVDLTCIRVVARPKEGMMGWDARTGLEASSGRYVSLIDGDGQFPMEALVTGLLKIRQDRVDLVTTYRAVRIDGPLRTILSIGYNLLFRIAFPKSTIRDVNSKPKVIRREHIQRMNLVSNDWFLDAEIMIKAGDMELRIEEFPVQFQPLLFRRSFVRFSAVIEFLRNFYDFRFRGGRRFNVG